MVLGQLEEGRSRGSDKPPGKMGRCPTKPSTEGRKASDTSWIYLEDWSGPIPGNMRFANSDVDGLPVFEAPVRVKEGNRRDWARPERKRQSMPRQRTHQGRPVYVPPDDLPDRIKRFLEEAGLTRAEVARRIGTSPYTVWRWVEGGVDSPFPAPDGVAGTGGRPGPGPPADRLEAAGGCTV